MSTTKIVAPSMILPILSLRSFPIPYGHSRSPESKIPLPQGL